MKKVKKDLISDEAIIIICLFITLIASIGTVLLGTAQLLEILG